MNYFPIKVFSGIETDWDGTDQDRGTLRRADGIVVAPRGSISKGPAWLYGWGLSTLGTEIAAALTGATANKVHFVRLAYNSTTFLIAWDMASSRARGIWHVAGEADPQFDVASGGAHTITAPNTSIYRNKTVGLNWFGSWCGGRLILGNGTDTDANLVWKSGALALLGPSSTPADQSDPSRSRFPGCTAFKMDESGQLFAAGNTSNPLRVWRSEKPNEAYPFNEGLLTSDRSFTDILTTRATKTTGLSSVGGRIVVHLDREGAVMLNTTEGADGFIVAQQPLVVNAGAINPNCTHDSKETALYFGLDLEIYGITAKIGRDKRAPRDAEIVTNRSAGDWNRALADITQASIGGGDPFVIYDDRNDRLWAWTALDEGSRQVLVCYDRASFAITGPILYPDLLCGTPLLGLAVKGCKMVGISRDGAFLFSDLAALGLASYYVNTLGDSGGSGIVTSSGRVIRLGEREEPGADSPLGADYAELSSPPAVSAGIPYMGVSADGTAFKQVLNSQTLSMVSPWEDWGVGDAVTTTRYFKNASLAVVELCPEDFGSAIYAKDFCEVRLQWRRNQRVYAGVFAESGGVRDGQWMGTPYPDEEMVVPIALKGTRMKIRLIFVYFNDAPATLPDISIGLLEGGPR